MSEIRAAALLVLLLPIPMLASQGVVAKIDPPYLEAVPGQSVDLRLIVMNLGSSEVNVTGLRVFITSEEIFLLPVRTDFGEYRLPLEEPVRVPPGGRVVIHKAVEVPSVPVFGRFVLRVMVETTGGTALSRLRVRLRHSSASLGVFAFLILSMVLLIYIYYRIIRGRFRRPGRFRQMVEEVDALLAERRRVIELMRGLEERRRGGRIGDAEYRRLRREYLQTLEEVSSRLETHLGSLRSMLSSIEDEISRLREEVNEIRARMESGDMRREEGERLLEERSSMIRSLEERAGILRERIMEMES